MMANTKKTVPVSVAPYSQIFVFVEWFEKRKIQKMNPFQSDFIKKQNFLIPLQPEEHSTFVSAVIDETVSCYIYILSSFELFQKYFYYVYILKVKIKFCH